MPDSAGDAAVPQSPSTADYVAIIVVIVACPFFMASSRSSSTAARSNDRGSSRPPPYGGPPSPRAGSEDDLAWDRLVSTTTGHPLNGMTELPLERVSRHRNNVDPTRGERAP